MLTRYLLPFIAVAGICLAIYTAFAQGKPHPAAAPAAPPAESPYAAQVAGSGIVEANTRNIAVGTPVPGVVVEVMVDVGAEVARGDPLFRLDDRSLQAQLQIEQAAVASARASLAKLRAQPRPEDVPPVEARVAETKATLADLRAQLAMWESVSDPRAISQEEFDRKRFAVKVAETRVVESEAALAQIKAGAWEPDIAIAAAVVAAAEARVDQARTELDRLVVRAPVDGRILQSNVRVGEFAATGVNATPLVLMGGVETLHVRVDVDENDAWRVRSGAAARASLRGNSSLSTSLRFVRFEPYVIPKKSLTGESTERVDTRVLQVIYSFQRRDLPVYVGQQMDVFIDASDLKEPR